LPASFLAIVAIPDISESCWREVAPSTDWVSNINGTISFQASRVNGSKSSYAKDQGSPQVSVPSEKAISQGMIESEYRENQLAVFLTEVHHPAIRGVGESTGTKAGRFATYRRHYQIIPKVGCGYLAVRHVLCRESE
jgi:predicted RNA binding protein YcfA (HicA-like mRNA interferase family)